MVQKCSNAARLLRFRLKIFLAYPIHLLMIDLWEKLDQGRRNDMPSSFNLCKVNRDMWNANILTCISCLQLKWEYYVFTEQLKTLTKHFLVPCSWQTRVNWA